MISQELEAVPLGRYRPDDGCRSDVCTGSRSDAVCRCLRFPAVEQHRTRDVSARRSRRSGRNRAPGKRRRTSRRACARCHRRDDDRAPPDHSRQLRHMHTPARIRVFLCAASQLAGQVTRRRCRLYQTAPANSLSVSRGGVVAEGSRRRFAGIAAMGVPIVLVAGQIQPMGRRTRPDDGVLAAVPPCIMFSSKEMKVLWRGLSGSDRGYQAERQRAGNQSRHVFPFTDNQCHALPSDKLAADPTAPVSVR